MLCPHTVPKERGAQSGDAHGNDGGGTRSHWLRSGASHTQEHHWDQTPGWELVRSYPAPQPMRPPGPIKHTEGASTGSRKIAPARVNVEEEAPLSLGNGWGLKASLHPPPRHSLSKQSLTHAAGDVTDLWTTWQTQQGHLHPVPFPPQNLNLPLGEGSKSPHPEPGLCLTPPPKPTSCQHHPVTLPDPVEALLYSSGFFFLWSKTQNQSEIFHELERRFNHLLYCTRKILHFVNVMN